MPYQFPPDVQRRVEAQMASGRYRCEDDVLLDALEALEVQNEDLAAIAEGIDDMEAGRVRKLSTIADEIRDRHGFRLGE